MQGERKRRLAGEDYWQAIDELCTAVKTVWPEALLQFEDFETMHAFEILQRFRTRLLCYNDDIQGTGAVVTAGVINGLRLQNTEPGKLRLVMFGAGSSAVGVAEAIAAYLEEKTSMSRKCARQAIYLVDSKGLVTSNRGDALPAHKQLFAREPDETSFPGNIKDLKDIIAAIKPHALVGLSAAGPSWTKEVILELCKHVEKPLVFPLSNPTDKAEITAEEAYEWSNGKAIFAAGSPFDPVEVNGKLHVPGQANNVFIFPGMGFGSVMSKSKTVTDAMFAAAAEALARCTDEEHLQRGELYPPMSSLRMVSTKIAAAVAQKAWQEGNSKLTEEPEDWEAYIKRLQWWPAKDF